MSMLEFVAKRVIAVVVITFLLVTVVFVLFRMMPSNPTSMVISPRMAPELKKALTERFGLEKPIGAQYLIYLENAFHGDLGTSFYWQGGVGDVLKSRLVATMLLTGVGLFIAAFIDHVAVKKLMKKSALINTVTYMIPFLFLGLLLIFVFSLKLDLLPVGGMRSSSLWGETANASAGVKLADIVRHLVLPLMMMVIWLLIGFLPIVKTTSQGVINEKKALIPSGLATFFAASVLFYGTMITESIFSWPGLHSAFIEASFTYDYPLVQGAVIVGGVFSLVVAVLTEVFYAGPASRARTTLS